MKPLSKQQQQNLEAVEKFIERCKVKRLRSNLNYIILTFAGMGDKSPIPIDRTVFEDCAELNKLLENVGG